MFLRLLNEYRFGFNGKEADNEINGTGNDYDFGARIYDARLGRWLSLDPKQISYPSLSAYNFTMNNPILFIDPDGKVVTIKDVASYKAVLGTLTAKEIERINVNSDGTLSITGRELGSTNLENLRILVDSKINHNIITTDTYKSAEGKDVKLRQGIAGRTLLPENEAIEMGLNCSVTSPDNDVYIIIKPTTEEGATQVAAHEAFGHAVLAEKKRNGEAVNPLHNFGTDYVEQNEDFKTQGWKAVGEAKVNYKSNTNNKDWKDCLEEKLKDFETKTKKK
ncbi:MAG: hypothetical protein CFE21_13685 [Bacteroidetes bacterium B1(2017)]|nr:MAG: hypothetical protein CFE21_13685 [Bacteroidetes bacterium B1(2017)]